MFLAGSSDHNEMLASCCRHCLQRDRAIQRHQTAILLRCQCQQMDVAPLAGAEYGIPGNPAAVEDAHGVRPEDGMAGRGGCGATFSYGPSRQWVGMAGLRHDADATVLGQRAQRPAGLNILLRSRHGPAVVQVLAVRQGDQHGTPSKAHQASSWLLRCSTCAMISAFPGHGDGRKL